ncbi:putative DNA topoisomerase 1 [Pseudomassariella vexata]|uniref:DNA topoisomerase I n=1 Tax=Pseudomassariella vexata TaxID=1141098 RepID=A0A1Y2E4F8_9PEZI|nr:putative DNA topoisomerase 1 [Pseudomassariella vexata]ORY66234.1 putative DNA topoisomerase 1 [Pseudomassariella vexata]
MSSDYSSDDMPLARPNGHLSATTISKAEDKAMDRGNSRAKSLVAPVSIRHGPIKDEHAMDIDSPPVNGNKRKSRSSFNHTVSYKDESDSEDGPMTKRQKADSDDSDDDVPLTKRKPKLPPKASETDMLDIDDSDDDEPLNVKLAQKRKSIENAAAREAKQAKQRKPAPKKSIKDESDDDLPLSRAKPAKRQSNGTAGKSNGVKKDIDSDSDAPIRKKKTALATKAKPTKATPAKKVPAKSAKKEQSEDPGDGEEGEEEYRWWDAPKKEDDSIKWNMLEHNGVLFPPEYEPLPKNVRLLYDGTPVNLHIEAEEVAGFFGAMLNSTHNVENPVFQKNFFGDFCEIITRTGGAKDKQGNKVAIKEFSKLDFKQIFEYYQAKSDARKARPGAEKKAEKAEKDKAEAAYMFCKWDGRKEKVGNFRVEPPGLFRGRGEHPKTGKVKKRVLPEQITINIGKDAEVPPAPAGHKWKAVQHDNKATWLAMWQENINGAYKYVMLAANSSVKGQSDFKKFEKARNLKNHIARIRKDYQTELHSSLMQDRQRATAMYLIDKLALRAGNEKDAENEAETVGCCSLKFEHVTLKAPDTVIFDFLGKDSIRYYDEVRVEKQVFKNFQHFKKPPKGEGDDLFDRLTTTQLNKHLSSYMPGLTAKVFRTYNASYTMGKLLKDIKVAPNMTVAEKVNLYNQANREVAVLCNHKRTVGAGHEAQMEKLGDRIKGLKFQQWRTKLMLIDVDPKQKKKKGADFFKLDEDLDDAWIQEHLNFLVEEERKKISKKFEKDNQKRVADGEKPMPDKELKERLKAADDLGKQYKKEYKSQKVEAEGKGPTVEKIEANIKKIDDRIKNFELQAADREGNKEVALGTSKINYIDPRLTVVFSKKFDVPIEKLFSKTLREKFNWAIKSVEDEENWEF